MSDVLKPGTYVCDSLESARHYRNAARAAGLDACLTTRPHRWVGRHGFTFEVIEYRLVIR